MRTRTWYESPEYENIARPGTFAFMKVVSDDDGLHLAFISGDTIILDLPIPACEAAVLRYVFDRAAKYEIRMAEQEMDGWTADTHDHAETHAGPLESGMTPYGPRQVSPADPREARGEPYTHSREMPVSHPSSLMATGTRPGTRPVRAVPGRLRRARRVG